MSTITYRAQPGIHKSRGSVAVTGTPHLYKVSKLLWPNEVEAYLETILIGCTLHVCSGKSRLGHIRLDRYEPNVDIRADAAHLPFANLTFDTVLCDPPYNGRFRWNHDLLNELHRVARRRIIFQHWFSPVNKAGQFKKAHVFTLTDLAAAVEIVDSDAFLINGIYAWMPRTYFGRMQIISIFDREAHG